MSFSTTSPPQGGNASSSGATTSQTGTKGHTHLFDIPYLDDDGNNFVFWKYQVQMVLELQGLWGIVDGTTTKPDSSALSDDKADWASKDQEARTQITLTLKDELLNSVLTSTSAKQCWEQLSAHYEGKGEQRIFHLIDEVFCSTFSKSEPLEPQINALVGAACTITTLGLALEDKLIMFAIISSLPTMLSTLKIILSTTNVTDLSSEYVKSQIILDEQHCIRDSGVGATTFFAKASKKGKGNKKLEEKAKKLCTHCNIWGHEVGECRKLKKQQEGKASNTYPKGSQSTATVRVAVADSAPTDTAIQLFSACAESPPPFTDVVHAFHSHPTPSSQPDLLQHWIIDSVGITHYELPLQLVLPLHPPLISDPCCPW